MLAVVLVIGSWVQYADDVILLAPSASVMRRMISICEAFAKDFRVTFNCDKTKCTTLSAPK